MWGICKALKLLNAKGAKNGRKVRKERLEAREFPFPPVFDTMVV